ncbi:TPA: phosphoadenosine phosphosulfate reductase family protein [Clostridium botulinum]|nr:phosphoadenosine phosphosulfate reductase family protein [Clostridium botulinum]
MQHIVSYSGGKDSTAMVYMMLDRGIRIDRIVFCDTGLELGETNNIIKIFKRKMENLGIPFDVIKSEKTFEDYFYTIRTTGKRKGEIWGWPFMLGAWCNSRLKIKPLNKYFKEIGPHIRFIGIAKNEPDRYKRLGKNERAPLYEWGVKEKDVLDYLKTKGFRNPLYWKFERLGCYLCPKQNLNALRSLRRHYPYLWAKMLKMDKDSPISFKADGTTLNQLDQRFKKEDSKVLKGYYPELFEPRLFYKQEQISFL